MNKKGVIPLVLIIIAAILLFIFIVSSNTGFKIAEIINEIPEIIWWIIIAIVVWNLFRGGKK